MGRKIFVSYKYGDANVPQRSYATRFDPTTVRHFVDDLQGMLEAEDHINKGEKDGESLANFTEETIASKLREKIYDSSITIVLISKGMKSIEPERDQWIPWEIAYSLKEHTRDGRTSKTNAVLAIVLPDENFSYSYYIEDNSCPYCNCSMLHTNRLFKILASNMFNRKIKSEVDCNNHFGTKVYQGDHSYIPSIKWSDFYKAPTGYIEYALALNDDLNEFNIVKQV